MAAVSEKLTYDQAKKILDELAGIQQGEKLVYSLDNTVIWREGDSVLRPVKSVGNSFMYLTGQTYYSRDYKMIIGLVNNLTFFLAKPDFDDDQLLVLRDKVSKAIEGLGVLKISYAKAKEKEKTVTESTESLSNMLGFIKRECDSRGLPQKFIFP